MLLWLFLSIKYAGNADKIIAPRKQFCFRGVIFLFIAYVKNRERCITQCSRQPTNFIYKSTNN